MATIGTTLRQGDTDTMTFRATGSSTSGEYVEVDTQYAPMPNRPPVHCHPEQDEHFEIAEGALTFEIGGERTTVEAGGSMDLPRGSFHTVWNASTAPTRFIWRTAPALRTEAMFELLWGLVEQGKMGRHGSPRPSLLQSTEMMRAYRREYRLLVPHRRLALPLCLALHPVARITGVSATHSPAGQSA